MQGQTIKMNPIMTMWAVPPDMVRLHLKVLLSTFSIDIVCSTDIHLMSCSTDPHDQWAAKLT